MVTTVPFLMMIRSLIAMPPLRSSRDALPRLSEPPTVRSTQTDFECRYGSSASSPSSLPNPECLRPPNGTATSNIPYVLIHTVPASSRSATRSALLMSDVQIPDARP